MKKLSALVLAGAGVAVLGLNLGAASAANCADGTPAESHGAGEINVTNPATGGHVYASQPGGTSGYIGTHGSTGYVEAYGSATTQSGAIEGSTADGSVNGKLGGSPSDPTLCVNGTTVL